MDPRVGKITAYTLTISKEKGERQQNEVKGVKIIPCSQIEELQTEFDFSIASFGYTCVAPDIEIQGNTFNIRTKESFSFTTLRIVFKLCNQKKD